MHVLRKCSLGLQTYSSGIFLPPPLSSAVGNIWPSCCVALPTPCCEHSTAARVSGPRRDTGAQKGTRARCTPGQVRDASTASCSPFCGLAGRQRRGTTGCHSHAGQDVPHRSLQQRRGRRGKGQGVNEHKLQTHSFLSVIEIKPEIKTMTTVAIAGQVLPRGEMIQLHISQTLASS